MTDLLLPGPSKGECACGCTLFGLLRKKPEGHVRGCECPRCRGGRNRAKGDTKARKARKALNLPGANTRHEELWAGGLLCEVKAGAQVKAAITAYTKMRAQSDASRSIGDNRPFVGVAMGDGRAHDVVLVELRDFDRVCFAYVEGLAT